MKIEQQGIETARDFFDSIKNRKDLDVHTDAQWPQEADSMLDKIKFPDNELMRLHFWLELVKLFENIEKREKKHYHKGQHHWRIGLIYLHRNKLKKALQHLRLSKKEDKIRYGNQFTASGAVLSLLEPLEKHSKKQSETILFFKSLSDLDIREFANVVTYNHNQTVSGRINLILSNATKGYKFIKKPTLRIEFKNKYEEIRDRYIIEPRTSSTYYGALFVTGSLLEGMLDDFFTRNSSELWNKYAPTIGKTGKYSEKNELLGYKVSLIKKMSLQNKDFIIPKNAILWMIMIQEYRNLIHPSREKKIKIYKPDRYVCVMLFSSIATIAQYWWPKKFKKV